MAVMKKIALMTVLVLSLSLGAATASAATEYEGRVVGKNSENRTFRLSDAERGTIRAARGHAKRGGHRAALERPLGRPQGGAFRP